MALSEFFPYGAPELIDGARTRMARSTMAASLAVAMLVGLGGALLPRQIAVVLDPGSLVPPDTFMDPIILPPPPPVDFIPQTPVSRPASDAMPVPVPDEMTKPRDVLEPPLPSTGPIVENTTETGPFPSRDDRGGGLPTMRDPDPGDVVIVDEMPSQIRCKEPVYPDLARAAGVEGTVTVRMLLGLNGKVERAIIVPRTSIPMLDQAALDAALTCVFTPALTNGHPVKVWVSQNYHFSLHSAP